MPIDNLKTSGPGDVMFVLRDPEQLYTHAEVCDLLELAEALGFNLDKGSELDNLSVRELDVLVHRRQ